VTGNVFRQFLVGGPPPFGFFLCGRFLFVLIRSCMLGSGWILS